MSCPVCQELLRRAREEAEQGPRTLAPAELARRGIGRLTTALILDLLAVLGAFAAAAWMTFWLIAIVDAPHSTDEGMVVIDCDRDKDLCSTLLSAGVVAAGDAEEE